MNAALIVLVVLAVLLGGTLFGVTGIFLVPLAGAVGILVLVIWLLRRRAEHKPPID